MQARSDLEGSVQLIGMSEDNVTINTFQFHLIVSDLRKTVYSTVESATNEIFKVVSFN